MEATEILAAFRRRRLVVVLILVAAVAVAAAVKLKSNSIPTGTATSQILVDSPQSAIADLQQDTLPLATRASVFAQLMTSRAVLQSIAHAAGIRAGDVTAEGPYSGSGQALDVPTPSEARGPQVIAAKSQYRLTFVAQTNLPIVTISAQGPTPSAAGHLANGVYPGVESWLGTFESTGQIPPNRRVTIRQLGDAQAGALNSSSSTALAGVAGFAIALIGLLTVVALESRSSRREAHAKVGTLAHQLGALPHQIHGLTPSEPTASDPEQPTDSAASFDRRVSVG